MQMLHNILHICKHVNKQVVIASHTNVYYFVIFVYFFHKTRKIICFFKEKCGFIINLTDGFPHVFIGNLQSIHLCVSPYTW